MQKILIALVFCFFIDKSYSQKLYSETGRASFYAGKFEGRKTAGGEIFSNKKMTAAHRTLAFGTMVKVTNLTNGNSIIVRINDRGPYAKGRIIDLTRAAADSLDILHSGWATVKVEELPPESVVASVDTSRPPLADPSRLSFPDDWMGNWEGVLKIYSAKGLEKNIAMKLSIAQTEDPARCSWTIVYDAVPRSYELILRDSVKGIYSLNEKNGIDIMSYQLGNHFLSRFSLEGIMLDCEYNLLNHDEMLFEIRSGNDGRHWTTGNIAMEADSIPEVNVFSISNLQVASLQRVKE